MSKNSTKTIAMVVSNDWYDVLEGLAANMCERNISMFIRQAIQYYVEKGLDRPDLIERAERGHNVRSYGKVV
jgi:predicted DNA-binding protein